MGGVGPFAAAAAMVGHCQIGQQRRLRQIVEHLVGPGQGRHVDAAQQVVAACQAGSTERAEHAAGQQTAAERQPAGQQVGLQPGQRAGHQAAPHRGALFVEPALGSKMLGQRGQHLRAGLAVEAMQFDQPVGGLANVGIEPLGEVLHRQFARRDAAFAAQARARHRRP